jgi:6-phosphogluconolactonase (cycloisomerase 2 family)
MKSILRLTAAASALIAVMGLASSAQAMRAYIGTYTADPNVKPSTGHGEGIYLVDFDPATGAPIHPRLVAKSLSPTWLAMSADHKFLYAANETGGADPNKTGSVTAYAIDQASGALKLLNAVSSGSPGICYVSISGKFVLAANYGGGSYAVIRIKPDGSLGERTDLVKPGGPLNPPGAADSQPGEFSVSDHRGSRGHMIGPDPTGQYIIGDDAGRDQIFVWKLDQNTGKLAQVSVTKLMPGVAPRHFVFSHDGKHMYQLQEQDSRLSVFDFAGGKLTQKGASISALPDGYQGSNTGSELLIDKAGKHLYFGNRQQDSIATFAIAADGSARKISNFSTEANNPRSLALDPSGRYLYSMNQGADNVTTFRIGANGVPKFTG